MTGSGKPPIRNVPPPQRPGSANKPASAYSRFIPREELGQVASWRPGTFGGAAAGGPNAAGGTGVAATQPAPLEPTGEELRERLAAERLAIRAAGYQEGYRDGLVALENFKQHFAAQATAQIGTLLEAFDVQLRELDSRVADTLARCAVQLAEQVVRSTLATNPEVVARVASDAVNTVMLSARHIQVHAHPTDLPLIAEGAREALEARGARLLADETVERGGVRVESDVGAVDARIAVRWAQAAAALGSDLPWDGGENAA